MGIHLLPWPSAFSGLSTASRICLTWQALALPRACWMAILGPRSKASWLPCDWSLTFEPSRNSDRRIFRGHRSGCLAGFASCFSESLRSRPPRNGITQEGLDGPAGPRCGCASPPVGRRIAFYNLKSSHRGHRLKGRTPAQPLSEPLGRKKLPPIVPKEEASADKQAA
jgi:hypothetical protein